MKTCIALTIGVCFALSVSLAIGAEGKGDKAAWETIDKAISASGAKKLIELPAQSWNESGTFHGGGTAAPYTGKYHQIAPEKFYMNILDAFVLVSDGEKGWIKMGADTQEMTAEQLKSQKSEYYAGYVSTLAPLVQDRSKFTAKWLGDSEVNGQETHGVAISSEGQLEVKVYFDKKTNLPAKIAYRAMSPEQGKEVDQEIALSEYKDVAGVQTATKFVIHRDGQVYVEGVMSDVKRTKTLDDSQFAKP